MNTLEEEPVTIHNKDSCSRETMLFERGVENIDIVEECKDKESQSLLRNNDIHPDATKGKSIWKETDWNQKKVVIYVSIVNCISFLCISACSSFLARVMVENGGTVVLSTIVLQISMVTMCISSIIFGKYQARIGSKTLIVSGQVVYALCQVAFGTIGYIENHWVLMAVGTLLRAVQGICQAALYVASLTLAFETLPDFTSTVFGIFQASYGAGYLSGPYLGGFLYDWSGGMMVPMAITGLLSLLFGVGGFRILNKTENGEHHESKSHIWSILNNPRAVFIIGTAGTLIGGFGLCDATITVYLIPAGFSATEAGQLLFLMGLAYCLFAVGIGFAINSRKVLRRFFMSLGVIGASAFPFLWVPNQLETWIYVAAFGFAMSLAIAYIPAFDELRHIVESDDTVSIDTSLNSALSGLWSAAVSIFTFTGPVIGSAMESNLPFYVAVFASSLIGYGCTILATLISAFYKRTGKKCLQ